MNETGRAAEFEQILDVCLDAVLSGEATIAECLTLYPDFADQLRPALQVGLLAHHLKKPALAADRVDLLESHLRQQMQPPARVRRVNFAPLGRLAAMLAIVLLVGLGISGGAVAASAHSLPGDPLYGLKRLWEAVVLALASLIDESDDVWLHLAQIRLDEAEDLAERGILYRDILVDLYDATSQSIRLADEETAPYVVVFLDDARTRLEHLPTTAATAPVHNDLLDLMTTGAQDRLPAPPSGISTSPDNGMDEGAPIQPVQATATLTPSHTSTALPTATHTASPTPTATRTATRQPTRRPTSRVPATATHTPRATRTPSPTPTATQVVSPTHTWTPLPLPFLPTSGGVRPTVESSSVVRMTATPVPPTADATIRYRDTQAAVYATQTAQAAQETEEPGP